MSQQGVALGRSAPSAENQRRQSPALDQFFGSIREERGLSILDLGGASQANVTFITELGHQIQTDDVLRALDSAFGEGDFYANQTKPDLIDRFASTTLDYEASRFGGALVWDTLQFLAPPLLQQTVDQLYDLLSPGAYLLAFFNSDEKLTSIPVHSYRIVDSKTVLLSVKGRRERAQFFNNRALEKLFANFYSVKFFLTRDNLREVIVRR